MGPEEGAGNFPFDLEMNDDNYTVAQDGYVYAYAHWTPNPTGSYKVVIWAQKVTDDKNAPDADKKYDYVQTYTVHDAVAGTPITEEELRKSSDNFLNKDNAFFGAGDLKNGSRAFLYDRFEVKNGIGAGGNGVSTDNSTVVNVYYDRALFSIFLVGEPGSATYDYYYPDDEADDAYALIDGSYVPLTTVITKKIKWSKQSGSLALPEGDLNQVKYGVKDGNKFAIQGTITVDKLQKLGGGTLIIDLDAGESNTMVYIPKQGSISGGTKYLFTTESTNTSYCQLKWLRVDEYSYKLNGQPYSGQAYGKDRVTGKLLSGLYGQKLTWSDPSGASQAWKDITWLEAYRGNLFGADGLGGMPNTIVASKDSNRPNCTIVFYFQDADDTAQYNQIGTAKYHFKNGESAKFNITERVSGGAFNGYKWSRSGSWPGNNEYDWDYELDNSNNTAIFKRNNTYLHIRYKRSTSDIVYMQGSTELTRVGGIGYEEKLAGYEKTLPPASSVTVGEGEFFKGWYEDPEGIRRVDWTGRMPLNNKIIYAVVQKAQYHVVIDMDGGTVPNNQKTEFWEDAGGVIDDTNFKNATKTDAQNNSYTLVGYYTDEAMTKLWNFDTPLHENSLWHIYDDTDGWDPKRNSDFFGEGVSDEGYVSTVGIFRLWAKWRNDHVAGGLHFRYKIPSEDGYYYTDQKSYVDTADVIAAQAPSENGWPEGKRFDGWKLKEGKVYQPGDVFMADSEDAVSEDGVYWITLTAVYKDREIRTPTHIYWYYNYAGAASKYFARQEDLGINVAVDVPAFGDNNERIIPERIGYKFLGWAKGPEHDSDGLLNEENPELFIRYDEVAKTYDVSRVAADEKRSGSEEYDAFYAVWKRSTFTICHSSLSADNPERMQKVEIPLTKSGDGLDTYDITRAVRPNYLYGGYYQYDPDATDGRGDQLLAPGTSMEPAEDQIYYLKEVDDDYLKPQLYLVFSTYTRVISNMYGLVNVDSADVGGDYQACGLLVRNTENVNAGFKTIPVENGVTDTIHVSREGDNEDYAKLGRDNFGSDFKAGGALAGNPCYVDISEIDNSYIKPGAELEIKAYQCH